MFMNEAKVPTQLIVVGNDPVVIEGIKRILASDQISVPVMVYGVPEEPEVIVGFKKEDYQRVIDDFRAKFVPGAPNLPAPEGEHIRTVVDGATASQPEVGRVADVPPVSGDVDGGSRPDAASASTAG